MVAFFFFGTASGSTFGFTYSSIRPGYRKCDEEDVVVA